MGSIRRPVGVGGCRGEINLPTGRVSTEKLGENILRMAGIPAIEPYISLYHFCTSF